MRTKEHQATPMTVDDALYEMELVGHDFFLFHDKESDRAGEADIDRADITATVLVVHDATVPLERVLGEVVGHRFADLATAGLHLAGQPTAVTYDGPQLPAEIPIHPKRK